MWKNQKFKETANLNYIYDNKLDKACFVHDAAYSVNKDLAKKTVSDKVLKKRADEIAINPKYDGYQRGLALWRTGKTRSGANVNEVLAQV